MRIKTIFVASLLLIAGIFGAFHSVKLPPWAWVLWSALLFVAVAAWLAVSRVVTWAARRAVLWVPIPGRIPENMGGFSIPVADLHASTARIEAEIARKMRFRPVAWLAVRAYRLKAGDYLGSILAHCKANGSDVFDARLFATWLHGKVAETLAQTAGEIASAFWMTAVIVLACLGVLFAMPHLR
jgi:hypothetical protein